MASEQSHISNTHCTFQEWAADLRSVWSSVRWSHLQLTVTNFLLTGQWKFWVLPLLGQGKAYAWLFPVRCHLYHRWIRCCWLKLEPQSHLPLGVDMSCKKRANLWGARRSWTQAHWTKMLTHVLFSGHFGWSKWDAGVLYRNFILSNRKLDKKRCLCGHPFGHFRIMCTSSPCSIDMGSVRSQYLHLKD